MHARGADAETFSKLGLPPMFRISAEDFGNYAPSEIERELNEQARGHTLKDGAKEAMEEALAPTMQPDFSGDADYQAAAEATCQLLGTSPWDFSYWNSPNSIQYSNNCYCYAANNQTNSFAQPGRRTNTGLGSLPPGSAPTVTNVWNGALGDGFKNQCNGQRLRVCFVIWPGNDYHWYRLNFLGGGGQRWCHKRGTFPVSNKDQNGNFITEPKTSARWNYNVFGKYMFVPNPRGNVR